MQRQGSQLVSHKYKLRANFFASKYFENFLERPYTKSQKRPCYSCVLSTIAYE